MFTQPHIIVEETEEDSDASSDITTVGPLRPAKLCIPTTFDDSLGPCPSPTPSTISRYDFTTYKIDDGMMKNLVNTGIISDRTKLSKLCKYVNKITMVQYAVAEWNLSGLSDEKIQEICENVEALCRLRHKRIASVYGYRLKDKNTSDKYLQIFRSCLPSGSLVDKLRNGVVSESQALKYTYQLLSGLEYLHDHIGRVHGNVSVSNLLLTLSNDIQLADLHVPGMPSEGLHKRRCLLNSPPEAFLYPDSFPCLTKAADVWASGCVLVAILTKTMPYQEEFMYLTSMKLYKALTTAWRENKIVYNSEVLIPSSSREASKLLDDIFVVEAEYRPSAQKLISTWRFSRANSRNTSSERPSVASVRPSHVAIPESFLQNTEDVANVANVQDEASAPSRLTSGEDPVSFLRWYASRTFILGILLLKWIGMVLCAALSLALLAGSVFLSIFLIYNGIQVVCQCQLNEGFIVLIALILLPIIILLTSLCCNTSLEKYRADVASGKLEESRFVTRTPERNVVLCGYIVVDGKPRQHGPERKFGIQEGLASMMQSKREFLSGVAKIA